MPLQLYEKEKILEACLSVFSKHGYEKTTSEMLAQAAGISRALVFHHFKSKKKLYFSLLEYCVGRVQKELQMDAIFEKQDFFEAIVKISLMKLDYCRKHPNVYKLVREAFYSPPNELRAEIEEKYSHILSNRNQMLKQLFEKVPLQAGINRRQAFELIEIASEHIETRFLVEVTDSAAMNNEHAEKLIDELNGFYQMICHGILP